MRWFINNSKKNVIYLTNKFYMLSINIDEKEVNIKLSFIKKLYFENEINILTEIEVLFYINDYIDRIRGEIHKLKFKSYYYEYAQREKNELIEYISNFINNIKDGD